MCYDYGECNVCGGSIVEQKVKQDFWLKGKLIVVTDVPAGVCERCGNRIVDAEVAEHLDELMRNLHRIRDVPSYSVPFVSYDKAHMIR